jgi:hypothetical protein
MPKVKAQWRTVIDPDVSHLRAFRHFHPAARIHMVEYRGRTVWMTDKQYNIWWHLQNYRRRGKRTTLEAVAIAGHCSRATASRFLRRLDLWRFIDLATIVGRRGGTWIMTRRAPTQDRELWRAGARVTMASRKIARARMAERVREWEAVQRMKAVWRPLTVGFARPVVRMQRLTGIQSEIGWE